MIPRQSIAPADPVGEAPMLDAAGLSDAAADPCVQPLTRPGLYFSVRHVARAMHLFGEMFERDYDCVVIFLTVAEACLQAIFHLAPGGLTPETFKHDYLAIGNPGRSIVLISDLTGIPRETVRRKVRKLVDQEQLAVHADGAIYLPAGAVMEAKMLQAFNLLLTESDQLVRAISYYDARAER